MATTYISVSLVHAALFAALTLSPSSPPPLPVATEKVVVHTITLNTPQAIREMATVTPLPPAEIPPEEVAAAPPPASSAPSGSSVPPITIPEIITPGTPNKKNQPAKPKPKPKPVPKKIVSPSQPAAEKPIPNAIKPVTPSTEEDSKQVPPPGLTPQQLKLLAAAKNQLAMVQKKTPSWQIESTGCSSYEGELIRALKRELILPEYGAVKIKLTVARRGTISKVQIISAESEKNKNVVEKMVKNIHLPSFGANFSGEGEHTFVIVLKNDT